MTIPIISGTTRWYCPACKATDTTTRTDHHQQFHTCPKLGFLSVPMVREGVRAKVEVNLIEGYVGREMVQYDAERRPVMNATITRDEGTDVAVYAPTAGVNVGAGTGIIE